MKSFCLSVLLLLSTLWFWQTTYEEIPLIHFIKEISVKINQNEISVTESRHKGQDYQ